MRADGPRTGPGGHYVRVLACRNAARPEMAGVERTVDGSASVAPSGRRDARIPGMDARTAEIIGRNLAAGGRHRDPHRVRRRTGGSHRLPPAYQSSTALSGAESTTQCCPQSVTAFTAAKLAEIAAVVDRRLIELMAVKREPG